MCRHSQRHVVFQISSRTCARYLEQDPEDPSQSSKSRSSTDRQLHPLEGSARVIPRAVAKTAIDFKKETRMAVTNLIRKRRLGYFTIWKYRQWVEKLSAAAHEGIAFLRANRALASASARAWGTLGGRRKSRVRVEVPGLCGEFACGRLGAE